MREYLGQYKARDGKLLGYRKISGAKDVIIYIHGIESNSGWFSGFALGLSKYGFTTYGIDRRGSGLNKEGRGDISSYIKFLEDIEDAIIFARTENPRKRVYLIGICWGALLAVNCFIRCPVKPDGLILMSPAIYRKVDLKPWTKVIGKICSFLCPSVKFNIPIKDHMFTTNTEFIDFIKNDKMRIRKLTARFFNQIQKMEQAMTGINHKLHLPILALLSGRDDIVDNEKTIEWFNKIESSDKDFQIFPNYHHVMPFEHDTKPLLDSIADWLSKRSDSIEVQSLKG